MKSLTRKFTFQAAVALIVALTIGIPLRAYVTSKDLAADGSIVQQRWRPAAFPLQWQMNPTQTPNVTGARTQHDVFAAAFAAWQGVTTATITISEGPQTPTTVKPAFDGINLITTNVSSTDFNSSALALTLVYTFDQALPNDGLGRPVEFPGQIAEADMMFNPVQGFSTSVTTPASAIDLQSVATHEVGHFLGLDHSTLVSATMFPTIPPGYNLPKNLSPDDMAAISTIYPSPTFAAKGQLSGTVRMTDGTPVFGAAVVAVNGSGTAVAGSITDPSGNYTIAGLDSGAYTVYAAPLVAPFTIGNSGTLQRIYPGSSVNTGFTARFH
jgi:Matrixin/Carboxypeptidase regulatory-like domain